MTLRWLLWGMVALGVAGGLTGAARRYSIEMRNRAVEISVDLEEVREAASAQGVPLDEALVRLKTAGANSVIVAEDTMAHLRDQGDVSVLRDPSGGTRIVAVGPGECERIVAALNRNRLPSTMTRPGEVSVGLPWSIVESIGVGLPSDAVAVARAAGLGVVGRVGAGRDADAARIAEICRALTGAGVRTVIFTGDVVLGYPKRLEATAQALRESDSPLQYGSVEFGKQRGDAGLTRLAPDRTVRVHAVTSAEMATATVPDNIQRFSLAARERNIRLCFVRLFLDAASPLDAAVAYVGGIRSALARGGMGSGPARSYPDFESPAWQRALCGLGVGAGVLLLLDSIAGVLRAWGGVTFVVPLVCAGLASAPIGLGAKLVALIAGCTFPALGMLAWPVRTPSRRSAAGLVTGLLRPSLTTAAGIALVVGLLADGRFLVKADAFTGVKATLAVPVALVAMVELLGLHGDSPGGFMSAVSGAWKRWCAWLSSPILAGQAVGAAVALALVAMLLLRSGNDPGVGVSDFELKIRALLDKVLTVRPRFKDILGHPALVLATAARMDGRRAIGGALLLLGTVGQSSLLNTFCHLHTPLSASALRDVIGLALGLPIGLLLVRFWKAPGSDAA
ncbi:MAG: DUF5693 family protein [Armatimonadota bacterium]